MEPRVLVGASPLGWVTALTLWVSEHGGAQIVGQALTLDDVHDADFDMLVLDSSSTLLSHRLVDEAQRDGRAVLVLVNADRPEAERDRMEDLGVSLVLTNAAEPEYIVGRAAEVAAVRRFTEDIRHDGPTETEGDPADTEHKLVVLLGAGGVTEVAVNLAAGFGRLGVSTLLADFDTVNPTLAQRLGTPVVPNLLTASDHVRRTTFGDGSVIRHDGGFDVIPGLANPREWDELSPVDTGELAAAFREQYRVTLAVVHPILEDLAPLSGLAGRFDVGRRLVELADDAVVVAAGSPIGLVQALSSIADVRAITTGPVHVAVPGMPRDAYLRGEWERELTRTFTPASLTFLPADRHLAKAAWDGRLPDRGRFTREVRRLTADLVGTWAA